MLSKVAVIALAIFTVAQAGQEAPPAKAVSYNVPSVAKVTYPGPTVHKSVETYSAPSIEKTTLITRTITAPLNAPPVKSVTYSAPAAPAIASYGVPAVAAAPVKYASYAAPAAAVKYASYAVPAVAAAPVKYASYGVPALAAQYGSYAAAPVQYASYAAGPVQYGSYAAAPVQYASYAAAPVGYASVAKAYATPTLNLASPHLAYSAAPALSAYAGSIGGATVYSAPSLGYSIGSPYAAPAVAAAKYAVPAAYKSHGGYVL